MNAAQRYATQRRRARARRTDPHTSHEAADTITADDLNRQQAIVLDVLRGVGRATDEQLVDLARRAGDDDLAVRISDSGVRTRRRELADLGMIHDTGDRARTRSGREAIVWAPTTSTT